MANVHDCWIVTHRDGRTVEARLKYNIHEVLFIACHGFTPIPGSPGTMTRIVAVFQNKYPGNRHRTRKQAA